MRSAARWMALSDVMSAAGTVRVACTRAVSIFLVLAAPAWATRYGITDLGMLGGTGNNNFASGINNLTVFD